MKETWPLGEAERRSCEMATGTHDRPLGRSDSRPKGSERCQRSGRGLPWGIRPFPGRQFAPVRRVAVTNSGPQGRLATRPVVARFIFSCTLACGGGEAVS